MKILVTGATGLVGSAVLREAIRDVEIQEVTAIVRNTPVLDHPKIEYVFHQDFMDYHSLADRLKEADTLLWCLGISQTQVDKKQYVTITYDYVAACVKACLEHNPGIRFIFVSGDGADRNEKSRLIFKRTKGMAENFLLHSGLPHVIIVRPDAIRPRQKNPRAPFLYKLAYPFFPLVSLFNPSGIIWSDSLAKALLFLAKKGSQENTINNRELKKLGGE
jgi:uncharacterized protein YbjT (DUF2867 family)